MYPQRSPVSAPRSHRPCERSASKPRPALLWGQQEVRFHRRTSDNTQREKRGARFCSSPTNRRRWHYPLGEAKENGSRPLKVSPSCPALCASRSCVSSTPTPPCSLSAMRPGRLRQGSARAAAPPPPPQLFPFFSAMLYEALTSCSSEGQNSNSQVEKHAEECPPVKSVCFQVCRVGFENVICGLA